MKMMALTAFVVSVFVAASASSPDICAMDNVKLAIELRCIREKAWLMLRNGLDNLLHVYQCTSDVCVFNKICDEGDLDDALRKYMRPRGHDQFWKEAQKCAKSLPPDEAYAAPSEYQGI